jgi:hypothetical protein
MEEHSLSVSSLDAVDAMPVCDANFVDAARPYPPSWEDYILQTHSVCSESSREACLCLYCNTGLCAQLKIEIDGAITNGGILRNLMNLMKMKACPSSKS